MLNIIIGKRLLECRRKKELTQEKLGEYLNVSHQVISKWENGITTPGIQDMFSLATLFGVSIDYLCGAEKSDREKLTNSIIERCPYENCWDYNVLYDQYTFLAAKLGCDPLNEDLLFYALNYLRWTHDIIQTDDQKEWVNDQILTVSQRLLDISKNDNYRSVANFNLAVYYNEHIKILGEPLPEQKENARKAREYADKVFYKDMYKTWYNMFGAENVVESRIAFENTLAEMIEGVNASTRNLDRHYKRQKMDKELSSLMHFSDAFSGIVNELHLK